MIISVSLSAGLRGPPDMSDIFLCRCNIIVTDKEIKHLAKLQLS